MRINELDEAILAEAETTLAHWIDLQPDLPEGKKFGKWPPVVAYNAIRNAARGLGDSYINHLEEGGPKHADMLSQRLQDRFDFVNWR